MAANKRSLKKEIHRICGAIAGECIISRIAFPGSNPEKFNELIYRTADLQSSALKLVNVDFPGSPSGYASRKEYNDARHAYYNASFAKLREHFNSRVHEIIHELNETIHSGSTPEERKARMKHLLELGFARQQ